MYEMMLKHLCGRTDDAKFGVAAAAGLEKLEIYYEKARGCQFNIIATCTFAAFKSVIY
jgi:hypothetical protein